MKKSVLIIVLSVLTLFAFSQFAFAIFTPTIPSSCSSGAITSTWDSIFKNVGSSGITIVNVSGDGKCSYFLAYKISGNLTNVLAGYDLLPYSANSTFYSAIEGNFSSQFQDILGSATSENTTALNMSLSPSGLLSYALLGNVSSIAEANTSFFLTFKADNSSWDTSGSGSSLVYTFSQSDSNSTTRTRINGGVYNSSLNYLTFNRTLNLSSSSCIQSWVAINTSCNSSDYKIMWYNDTNNCSNSTGKPVNVSISCDYDLNGIIGNFSSFTESNIDLELYINGSLGNISKNYTGTREVIFREVDTEVDRLSFNYSFDSPFDIRGVSIEVEDGDSHYGYIVIRGLNITKTARVDKLNSSSVRVCVKNTDGTIDDVTDNCDGYREYLIDCPGSSGSIRCSLDGNLFVVSGLTRSIVKEWLNDLNDTVQECTTNWSCTAFSECGVSGTKTKICTDRAYCNSTVNKPATVENCTFISVCNTNWSCSDWAPTGCPTNLTQTRTCRDTNVCNITSGKPNQVRTCERQSGTNWGLIGIIIGVVILLIIAVIIIISKLNGGRDDSNYVNIQGFGGPRTPPGGTPPGGGYAPIIARPMQRPPQMIPLQPRPMQPRPILNPAGMPMPPRTY